MNKKKGTAPETGAELATLSDKQMEDYTALYAGEWGGRGPTAPEIKISYDKDDTLSHYVIKQGEEVEDLGETCDVVIVKCRNQYSLYSENQDEALKTDEFDDFKQDVILRKGNDVIMCAPYPEVKAVIKEKYPDMKFINVLYVLYNEKIHKIYVKPASRQPLWDYQAATTGRASFSFITTLGTTTGKKGATTYYPMTFEKKSDMNPAEFKKMMALRIETDKAIDLLETANSKKVPEAPKEDLSEDEIIELFEE